jgi:antitoxin component YwqK of YwqJK toxin-antitoxin module
LEYYVNNDKKTVGKVSKFEPWLIYEELLVSYFPNGKKKEIKNYLKGKLVGESYAFYQNGQLKQHIEYSEDKASIQTNGSEHFANRSKMKSYYDSLGVQLIKDGNGPFKTFGHDSSLIEEGTYLNGEKNGLWKGDFLKSNASYEEQFENGKFISGVAKLSDGTTNPYIKLEIQPEYKGGLSKFLEFVGNNYKYTTEAQKQQVSGRVYASFVIEEDGSLTNIKILKDLGYGTGEEAIRILMKSKNWIPGTQHGIPVRVQYTLPLVLALR